MYPNIQIQVISCWKTGGFVKHEGLLFLPDALVAHCSPRFGSAITTITDFLGGANGYKIERTFPARLRREFIRRINWALVNRPLYDLLLWNCRGFVAFVTRPADGEPWNRSAYGARSNAQAFGTRYS